MNRTTTHWVGSLLLIALLTLPSTSFSAGAGASVGNNRGTIFEQDSTYYPPAEGDEYRVLEGGVGASLDLGCDGLTMPHVMSSFLADYKAYIASLKQNALGLAINALAYSFPTIYATLQDMNVQMRGHLDASLLTCNSVREWGKTNRDKALAGRAKDLCLQDGNGPDSCNDGDLLKTYTDQALKEKSQVYRAAKAARKVTSPSGSGGGGVLSGNNGGIGGGLSSLVPLGPSGTRPADGQTRTNDLLLDGTAVNPEFAAVFYSLVPGMKIDDGNQPVTEARKTTLQELVRERTEKVRKIVNDLGSGDSAKNKAAMEKLEADPVTRAIPAMLPNALAQLDLRNPGSGRAARDAIARDQSITWARNQLHQVEIAILNAQVSGRSGTKLDEADREHYDRVVRLLEAELAAIEDRYQMAARTTATYQMILREGAN